MTPTLVRIVAPGATSQLIGGSGRFLGWSLRETTGAASAVLQFLDGDPAGLGILATISLTAGQSTRDWESFHPMPYYQSINLRIVSGAVEGVIGCHPCDPESDWHIPVVVSIPGPIIDWSPLGPGALTP